LLTLGSICLSQLLFFYPTPLSLRVLLFLLLASLFLLLADLLKLLASESLWPECNLLSARVWVSERTVLRQVCLHCFHGLRELGRERVEKGQLSLLLRRQFNFDDDLFLLAFGVRWGCLDLFDDLDDFLLDWLQGRVGPSEFEFLDCEQAQGACKRAVT